MMWKELLLFGIFITTLSLAIFHLVNMAFPSPQFATTDNITIIQTSEIDKYCEGVPWPNISSSEGIHGGCAYGKDRLIYINKDMNRENKLKSCIHEVLHVIVDLEEHEDIYGTSQEHIFIHQVEQYAHFKICEGIE